MVNKALLHQTHTKIQQWYASQGRHHLPWRQTRDPYAIYLSEIMLQQTQVKTVQDRYFQPFLDQFPTLETLAAAPQDHVLKAWQGLGYYNRAINLHRAAQQTGNALPDNVEALLALPGIGRNTAHAVAAFAFRQPVPIMEANVKRILFRVFAMREASDKLLWEKAWALLDTKHPYEYNQALMDIGSFVCTPKAPRCGDCPLAHICEGKHDPLAYPAPKQKKRVPVRQRHIVIFRNAANHYYLAARKQRFLNGLYGFPEYDTSQETVTFQEKPYILPTLLPLGGLTQHYSHFTLEGRVWLAPHTGKGSGWFNLAKIQALPLSQADLKALALLDAHLTKPGQAA